MARADRIVKASENLAEERMNNPVFPKQPVVNSDEPKVTVDDVKKKLGDPSVPQTKLKKHSPEQAKFIKRRVEVKNVYKTYRVNEDVVELIDSLVSDDNGKKISGTRGLVSQIVNNALIKELISMGLLDKSAISRIKEY